MMRFLSSPAPGTWRSRSLAAVLGASVLVAACDNDLVPPAGEGPVVDVLINTIPYGLSLDAVPPTFTRQLLAAPVNADGQYVPGQTVTWSSSAPSIVSVDPATGLATAVAEGTATITASAGGAQGTREFTVKIPPGVVTVTPGETFSVVGVDQQLGATAIDGFGAPIPAATFVWTSSDEGVATVDGDGTVTPVAVGTATISATSAEAGGVSGTAKIVIAPQLTSGTIDVPDISAEGFVTYGVVIPAGTAGLTFATIGGSGDADVYTFAPGTIPGPVNTNPNAFAFTPRTCASATSGNDESCDHGNPAAGVWRIHIFAWGPAGTVSGLDLTVTITP